HTEDRAPRTTRRQLRLTARSVVGVARDGEVEGLEARARLELDVFRPLEGRAALRFGEQVAVQRRCPIDTRVVDEYQGRGPRAAERVQLFLLDAERVAHRVVRMEHERRALHPDLQCVQPSAEAEVARMERLETVDE